MANLNCASIVCLGHSRRTKILSYNHEWLIAIEIYVTASRLCSGLQVGNVLDGQKLEQKSSLHQGCCLPAIPRQKAPTYPRGIYKIKQEIPASSNRRIILYTSYYIKHLQPLGLFNFIMNGGCGEEEEFRSSNYLIRGESPVYCTNLRNY